MKLNKKGSAMVELIISLVIFATIVLIVTNFRTYLATHEASMIKQTTFYTHIDNELAYMYSEDNWDNLKAKSINTDNGQLNITIENLGVNEFDTRVIKVKFELQDLQKTLELERSVYYNE